MLPICSRQSRVGAFSAMSRSTSAALRHKFPDCHDLRHKFPDCHDHRDKFPDCHDHCDKFPDCHDPHHKFPDCHDHRDSDDSDTVSCTKKDLGKVCFQDLSNFVVTCFSEFVLLRGCCYS